MIIFKTIEPIIKTKKARAAFRQGNANIATYTVSVVADRIGARLDLDLVGKRQGASTQVANLILEWAVG